MPTSQNGWPARPDLPIVPLVVNDVAFVPGIRGGVVHTVLAYVAQQVADRVEAPVNPGCWGFSFRPNANDPNSLSNHSSGTAIDFNAPKHPNGVPTKNTFTAAQIAEVHKILGEVDGVVRWGGDYTGTPDAMHFEINADRAAVAAVARKLKAKPKKKIRVVSHNIHSAGRSAGAMRDQLIRLAKRTHRPHVIALQEAIKFHGSIPGYTAVRSPKGNPESGQTVLLVRSDIEVLRTFTVTNTGPHWTGPVHGLDHPPRTFTGAAVLVDGKAWDVLSVHRAWGGFTRNRAAWIAEDRALYRFVSKRTERRPGRPLVLVGDWNDTKVNRKPLSIRNFARANGARLVISHIDGAVVKNAKGRIRKLARKFGSDHRPVVLDLEEN